MTDDERRRIVERVLDLADMAEPGRGTTESERATAMRLGQRLIAKHSLTLEECEAAARRRALPSERPVHTPPPPPQPPAPIFVGTFGAATATGFGGLGQNGIYFEIRLG